jgi:hypothetical protein
MGCAGGGRERERPIGGVGPYTIGFRRPPTGASHETQPCPLSRSEMAVTLTSRDARADSVAAMAPLHSLATCGPHTVRSARTPWITWSCPSVGWSPTKRDRAPADFHVWRLRRGVNPSPVRLVHQSPIGCRDVSLPRCLAEARRVPEAVGAEAVRDWWGSRCGRTDAPRCPLAGGRCLSLRAGKTALRASIGFPALIRHIDRPHRIMRSDPSNPASRDKNGKELLEQSTWRRGGSGR